MPTARTAQNGRVPESAAKERTFAVPHYADGAEPDHLPLWPSLRGSQTALFRPVAVATGDRRLRVRTNVGDEARTESEMAKGLKAEQVKEETANGRGHHGNGVANGKATNGHVATAAEETAGTNGFIASLLGRGNKAVSTPPASQPSSNGSSVAPSPGRNSIRGKRYSGIIHANGVHRECFSDDGVTMVVESVAEKVAGIGFSVNGEPSPPLTPSPGLTETIDGSTYNGPLFRLPLPKNGLAYAPPPPPKSHLTFLNQRMDRPLVALALHSGLHYFTSRFIVPRLATGHLTAKDRVYLPEKLPSTVNAAFVGCLALYSVLKRGLFWGQGVDKINSWSDEVDLMFAGHLGFTLYDSYVMAALGGEHPSVWTHHVLGILGTLAVRAYKKLAFYPTIFSVCELTVVPSNILWTQQKLYPSRRDVEGKLLFLRAIFFALFRTPAAIVAALGTWFAVSKEPNLLQRTKDEVPPLISLLCAVNVAVFGGLNTWWTALVVKALIRHRNGTKSNGALAKAVESVAGSSEAANVLVHHI